MADLMTTLCGVAFVAAWGCGVGGALFCGVVLACIPALAVVLLVPFGLLVGYCLLLRGSNLPLLGVPFPCCSGRCDSALYMPLLLTECTVNGVSWQACVVPLVCAGLWPWPWQVDLGPKENVSILGCFRFWPVGDKGNGLLQRVGEFWVHNMYGDEVIAGCVGGVAGFPALPEGHVWVLVIVSTP